MKMTHTMIVLGAALCFSSPVFAAEIESTLSEAWMAQAGDSYFQAQNELLNDSDAAMVWTKGVQAPVVYDSETWMTQVIREATMLRLKNSQEVERLYNLNGLRSENYLRWRRPEPAVLRELKPMKNVVASMMELYQLGFESYPWSGPAYEKSERLALQMGLLHAIGESNHPARVFFLSHVVESSYTSRAVRLSALSALAKTGELGALKLLADMLDDAQHDDELRAWLAGSLGHIRSADTWPMIESLLADPSEIVRQAALASVRLLMSRWHWDGRGQELANLRVRVTPTLVGLLEKPEYLPTSNLGETLSLVGGEAVLASLKERLVDPSLQSDIRSRMQSVLSLVERAERRRRN